jgi:flagellin-like protein
MHSEPLSMRVSRGVSPIISVILMVAIVVILVTTASVFIFDSSGGLNEPAPFVADTTGEFVIDNSQAGDNQIVQVTHRGGDGVAVDEIEIIVRASGPSLDTEARLVDLPADDTTIDNKNIEGNVDLIDTSDAVQIIQEDDSNVWSAGDTITFRINTGDADFRIERYNTDPEADTLEVMIVHTPSNAIISEHTFTP